MRGPALAIAVFCCLLALEVVPSHAQPLVTRCGIDLSSGIPGGAPNGPVCGTDEGDDAGFAGDDTPIGFFGENGHDTVAGSRYPDVLKGGPGNDEIHGGRENDRLDGGDDSDVLFGGLGNDTIVERRFGVREQLYGGPGDDVVGGGRGNDFLYGNTGNDTLLGGPGPDRLFGGPGDDVLYGGPNRDVFDCGPGFDTVFRVRGGDTGARDGFIPREAGCERLIDRDPTSDFLLRDRVGSGGADTLVGGPGRDLLQGKGRADRLFGGGGEDELEGDGAENQGGDLMMGGSGADRLAGRSGSDKLYGDARSPVAGPAGQDEIAGGAGRDLMVGGPGHDLIFGAYDGDEIFSGGGNDRISLLGGDTSDPNGRVSVECGSGRDVVVINPARRGTFRNCETFQEQFHEADFGFLFRPSPESYPGGLENLATASSGPAGVRPSARAAHAARGTPRARRSQAPGQLPPADPDGGESGPSISGDGSRVSFSSDASNLIPNDTNGQRTDPFVRDLAAAQTIVADARGNGQPALRGGRFRRGPGGGLSSDGRYAVFSSNSQDIGRGLDAYTIFRRDLARRVTEVACRRGDDDSENAVISAGGQHIVFESRATNLAGVDENGHTDIYWCDMTTREVRRVSVPLGEDDEATAGSCLDPAVSADGRFVAFTCDSGGMVANDGGRAAVYLRDMAAGETKLVDVPQGGTSSDGNGLDPLVSADGRFVFFDSDATDLDGTDPNGRVIDVYRKDMTDGSVMRVSVGANGGADADSTADSVSADGNIVAFSTTAGNLAAGDTNGRADVYVRNIAAGATGLASARADGGQGSAASYGGALSADGRYLAFGSRAPNIVDGTSPSTRTRIYRRDLLTGTVDRIAVGMDLPPSSLVAEPSGTELRRRVRVVAGTADDNALVARVDVAVFKRAGGRCAFATRGGRLARRPCGKPLFLRASLENGLRWAVRFGRLLPRGTYAVRARATDIGGQAEPTFRTGRNSTSFTLR